MTDWTSDPGGSGGRAAPGAGAPSEGGWQIGILADPEAAPAEVAAKLADGLPDQLSAAFGSGITWSVDVEYERLPSGQNNHPAMINRAVAWKRQHGADLVVCVTDLPLRVGRQPVVAELSKERGVAVVSLPSFGGMALHRQVRRLVTRLVAELLESGTRGLGSELSVDSRACQLSRHFHREDTDNTTGVDVRIIASRGSRRLLVGMVRDNRPWRLAGGLTGAMVAAFAISAFYLISETAWAIANTLGPLRLAVASIASLAALVLWLIVRHNLWERPRRGDLPRKQDEVVLLNAATVLTLTVGVASLYAVLFVVIFGAALLLVDGEVLSQRIGSPTLGAYANIAWFTSSVAALGGALGSGLDSDKSVRAAAYSTRERERRARWDEDQEQAQEQEPEEPESGSESAES